MYLHILCKLFEEDTCALQGQAVLFRVWVPKLKSRYLELDISLGMLQLMCSQIFIPLLFSNAGIVFEPTFLALIRRTTAKMLIVQKDKEIHDKMTQLNQHLFLKLWQCGQESKFVGARGAFEGANPRGVLGLLHLLQG